MNENILFLDFETRSEADLKTVGAVNYAQHPSTDIIMMGYAFDDNPVEFWHPREKLPVELINHTGYFCAHNYKFEWAIIEHVLSRYDKRVLNWLKIDRWLCTMSQSLRWGLPAGLKNVSHSLKLDTKKLDSGTRLINKYSKPRRKTKTDPNSIFNNIYDNEDDLQLMREYCRADVEATREIYAKLPPVDGFERSIFQLDHKINSRGIKIDTENLEIIKEKYDRYYKTSEKLADSIAGRTKTGTLTVKSPAAFKTWLNKHLGTPIADTQKPTLDNLLDALCETPGDNADTKNLIEAVRLRRILSASAPKKLVAMKNNTDDGGITKNILQYYGAHTGRWAGRGIQVQNIPRDCYSEHEFENKRDKEVDFFDIIKNINGLLRPLIIPRDGKKFFVGDFSAIEARVTFWLAQCENGLHAYRQNKDIYTEFAAKNIFNKPPSQIFKYQRQIGKMAILGLGYGMGKNRFYDLLQNIDDELSFSFADRVVKTYRNYYREVPILWQTLENDFIRAVKGQKINRGVYEMYRTGQTLRVILPSGREMSYFRPGVSVNGIFFTHPKLKKIHIWGGVLTENLVQAIARDIMAEAMILVDSVPGLNVIMTVHDEIVAESKNDDKIEERFEKFKKIMGNTPSWARGLPITSECDIKGRYGK